MGDSGAEFTFIAASTFTSLPNTMVQLVNGASAGNVYWFIGSSATIGDYSVMVGNIIAYASITLNSYSTLLGRGLAGAAITCASGSTITLALQTGTSLIVKPALSTSSPTLAPSHSPHGGATPSPSVKAPRSFPINFLGCSDLVLQAQSAITFGGEHSFVTGDIGISPGTSITGEYIPGHYGNTYINDAYAMTCAADMNAILAQGAGQACRNIYAELGKDSDLLHEMREY